MLLERLIEFEAHGEHELIRLCDNGIFRNRAFILNPNYEWEFTQWYYLNPNPEFSISGSSSNLFTIKNYGRNSWFEIDPNGAIFMGYAASPINHNYNKHLFKYQGELLLVCELTN